ncbi:MAG TPA: Hsp20/alpha crystallin family protein [Tepidisphaeraceae bacterium]|jgi:HSP20 family protein|nr:Hsp20/alpha crystallin family protein [Tepidisphaeraceae bacterium]
MSLTTNGNRTQQYLDPLDSVLNRFFRGQVVDNENGTSAPYGVDARENGEQLIVEAELPGFKKDEVDITLENQVLTIRAQKKVVPPVAGQPSGGAYLLRERRYSRVQRSFNLPDTIDDQSVNAKLEDGVLTITLNKRPETKPRKIQVS